LKGCLQDATTLRLRAGKLTMHFWTLVDSARVPGNGGELRLYRLGGEFSIRVDDDELMNSLAHGSEVALAEIACGRVSDRPHPRVLIGGLGMGYTLAAALQGLGPEAKVVVAELVSAVVAWNRGPLAALAGHPLEDSRVTVREVDVRKVMQADKSGFDAILLDVDNGPEGLTRHENNWLYGLDGLSVAFAALRSGGVLAVWSAGPDPAFTQRLHKVGFMVEEVQVRLRGFAEGERHTIWLGSRVD
jgi:spermidine synthase